MTNNSLYYQMLLHSLVTIVYQFGSYVADDICSIFFHTITVTQMRDRCAVSGCLHNRPPWCCHTDCPELFITLYPLFCNKLSYLNNVQVLFKHSSNVIINCMFSMIKLFKLHVFFLQIQDKLGNIMFSFIFPLVS